MPRKTGHFQIDEAEVWAEASRRMPPLPPPTHRTVLVHLNVQVPEGDARKADVIADAIMACYEIGSDNAFTLPLDVSVALAQEL